MATIYFPTSHLCTRPSGMELKKLKIIEATTLLFVVIELILIIINRPEDTVSSKSTYVFVNNKHNISFQPSECKEEDVINNETSLLLNCPWDSADTYARLMNNYCVIDLTRLETEILLIHIKATMERNES
jgi:hypothetical protein